TGIGHATNETVSEMVAFKNAITPSELADFLSQRFHEFAVPVLEAEAFLTTKLKPYFLEKNREIHQITRQFQLASQNLLRAQGTEIAMVQNALKMLAKQSIQSERNTLNSIEQQVNLLHPHNVLMRGFSISYQNGRLIKKLDDIDIKQEMITQFFDGEAISSVIQLKKNSDG